MNPETDFTQLASLLRRRLEVIADSATRAADPDTHLRNLQNISEAILKEHQRLKTGHLPPRLDHFLTQCSFDKALAFIEDAMLAR